MSTLNVEFKPETEGVFYNLPADIYHKAPGVSQSTLKRFGEAGSPLHFRTMKAKKATADMRFGTICHTAILEPEKLAEAYHVQPAEYPKEQGTKAAKTTVMKPWSGNAAWCQDWTAAHQDRTVITAEQEAGIPKIVERVKRLRAFGSALENGKREVSFFKRDEETGLLLKGRCDVIAPDTAGNLWIFDPKKVGAGEGSPEAFASSCLDYGYHVQNAAYLELTGAAKLVFVPFDDAEPFDATQYELSPEFLALGRLVYRDLLARFAKCVREDFWPGYEDGINALAMPPWAKRIGQAITDRQHEAWVRQVV